MTEPTVSSASVAVGVCTYRRRASLERTLTAVALCARELRAPPIVIVVDNDGSDPEVERTVAAFAARSGLRVRYRVEPAPGISAARNAVFDEAAHQQARFLAMIDDDEWPSALWLAELLRVQAATGATVVGGPVQPEFPASAQALQRYARFWSVQQQFLLGKPFVFCTCNALVDLHALTGQPRPLFDDAFGLSGGGDTVFFRRLFFRGVRMAWADAACVYEEVPASRASLQWMRQRRYRVGNHAVRWESDGSMPWRSFVKTLGLTLRLAVYPSYRREPEAPWLGWLLELDKVRGRWAAHFGRIFIEYARPLPQQKACR